MRGGKLSSSWRIAKASWAVLRANPVLLVFPVISGAAMLLLAGVITGISWLLIPETLRHAANIMRRRHVLGSLDGIVLVYGFLALTYVVELYVNTALTGAIMQQLEG